MQYQKLANKVIVHISKHYLLRLVHRWVVENVLE